MKAKINTGKRVFLWFVTLLLILLVGSIKVFGANTDAMTTIQGAGSLAKVSSDANNAVEDKTLNILKYNSTSGIFSFDNTEYNELTADEKTEFMKAALGGIKNSGLSKQQMLKAYNFVADQDTPTTKALKYLQNNAGADFVSASEWFRPFSGVFGTIMGILTLFIFVFIALSTLFDIAYIVLPAFQALMEGLTKDPNKRPFGVSREAWKAVKESDSGNEYKNPISIYFKNRVVLILLMAIALGYLISGHIYDVLVYIIDAFTGKLS